MTSKESKEKTVIEIINDWYKLILTNFEMEDKYKKIKEEYFIAAKNLDRLEKLEKAFEILNCLFHYKIEELKELDGSKRFQLTYKDGFSKYGYDITQEKAELLKEVLEDAL